MASPKASGLDVYSEVGAGDNLGAIYTFTKTSGPVLDVATMSIIRRIFLRHILPPSCWEPPYAEGVSKEDFFLFGVVVFLGAYKR